MGLTFTVLLYVGEISAKPKKFKNFFKTLGFKGGKHVLIRRLFLQIMETLNINSQPSLYQ